MIINVSGYGNNCGLYALGLAVSMAVVKTSIQPQAIPAFVVNIKEKDVLDSSSTLAELGISLRGELSKAMHMFDDFKQLRIHSFIQLCLNSENSPADMEAFMKGNVGIIAEIKKQLESLVITADDLVQANGIMPDIDLKDMGSYYPDLIKIIQNEFTSEQLMGFLTTKYLYQDVENLFNVCKLFNQAWAKIVVTDASEQVRQHAVEVAEKWFFIQADTLFKNVDDLNQKKCLINLAKCRTFMKGSADDAYNAREVHANALVRRQWDAIFNNYTNYIAMNSVQLSSDEINCLARAWNTVLAISIDGKKQTFSHGVAGAMTLNVAIANPSQGHWMVLTEGLGELPTNDSSAFDDSSDEETYHEKIQPYDLKMQWERFQLDPIYQRLIQEGCSEHQILSAFSVNAYGLKMLYGKDVHDIYYNSSHKGSIGETIYPENFDENLIQWLEKGIFDALLKIGFMDDLEKLNIFLDTKPIKVSLKFSETNTPKLPIKTPRSKIQAVIEL